MEMRYSLAVKEFVNRQSISGLDLNEFSVRGELKLPIVNKKAEYEFPRLFDSVHSLRITNLKQYENNIIGSYIASANETEYYSGELAAGIRIPLNFNLVPLENSARISFRLTEIAETTASSLVIEYIGTVVSDKLRYMFYKEKVIKNI